MTNILQRTFKGAVGLAVLLAVMTVSSTPAYAQRCEARKATTNPAGDSVAVATVRAEGTTEQIGGIELRCVPATGTSLFDINEVTIAITLNAPITNTAGVQYEADQLTAAGALTGGDIAATVFDDGDADTDDGPMVDSMNPNTVTWEDLDGDALGLGSGGNGFNVIFTGIRVNANMVGDGGDITAQLTVNDGPVPGAHDISEVKTALDVTVDGASVLQCRTMTSEMATITIKEGFATALQNQDASDGGNAHYGVVRVNFDGIPDGVTVMITHTAHNTEDGTAVTTTNPVDAMKFTLTSTANVPTSGTMIAVTLDDDGDGMVTYNVSNAPTDTSPAVQMNMLKVSFTWDDDAMIADGMVKVGFVSGADDAVPQFAAGESMRIIGVDPCETSMMFPFVTNMYGYDTGLAITNGSDYAGTCMIEFQGGEGSPDDMTTMQVMPQSTMTYVLSGIAMGFQGFLDVTCDFEKGQGLAIITDGAGAMPNLAHGYLAIVDE